MATRPVFCPASEPPFVKEVPIQFNWHPGFAHSQKMKSIASLYSAAQDVGLGPLLEVSTKSPSILGVQLSAFNLMVQVPDVGTIPLESAFQGSKYFIKFGSCTDLYGLDPRSAKRAAKERDHGDLVRFEFAGDHWELDPKTAFYDWLYLRALLESMESELSQLTQFSGFTDIEFNPQRSFNCQAKSCALAVSLLQNGLLEPATRSKTGFLDIIRRGTTSGQRNASNAEQPRLF